MTLSSVSIEHNKKLASKEENLLKLRTSLTRLLEEAKSVIAKKDSSIKADNATLCLILDEIKPSHQVANNKHDKKLGLKEEDILEFGEGTNISSKLTNSNYRKTHRQGTDLLCWAEEKSSQAL